MMLQTLWQFLAWITLAAMSGVIFGWALGRSRSVVMPASDDLTDTEGLSTAESQTQATEISQETHSDTDSGIADTANSVSTEPATLVAVSAETPLVELAPIELPTLDLPKLDLPKYDSTGEVLEVQTHINPDMTSELVNTVDPETALDPETAVGAETSLEPETSAEIETAAEIEITQPTIAVDPEIAAEWDSAPQPENAANSNITEQPEITEPPAIAVAKLVESPVDIGADGDNETGVSVDPELVEHIRLLGAQVNQMRIDAVEADALIEELETQLRTCEIESITSNETVQSLRDQLMQTRAQTAKLRAELALQAKSPPTIAKYSATERVKKQVEKLKQENSALRLQAREAQRLREQLDQTAVSHGDTASLEIRIRDLVTQLAQRDSQLAELESIVAQTRQDVLSEQSNPADVARIAELQHELITVRAESMSEIDALTQRLAKAASQHVSVSALTLELQEAKKAETKASALATSLEQERRVLQEQIVNLNNRRVELAPAQIQTRITELEVALTQARATVTSLRVRLAECQSKNAHK